MAYKFQKSISIDKFLAIIGAFLGFIIIFLGFITELKQQDLGLAILLSCSMYIYLKPKIVEGNIFNRPKPVEFLPTSIIFFIGIISSLIIWYNSLYEIPILYYIIISFSAGIIGYQLTSHIKNKYWCIIVIEIVILSSTIISNIYYNFPSLMGADAFWHAKIIDITSTGGFMPPVNIAYSYSDYPIFYILVSILKKLCQTTIKDSIFLSISLSCIIATLFIYLIAKELDRIETGLLAMLLINLTPFFIIMSVGNIIPGALANCYFLILLFLILFKKLDIALSIIMLIITFSMLITHQLTTFISLICILAMYFSKFLYNKIYKNNVDIKLNNIKIFYLLTFVLAMLSYWMNSNATPKKTFLDYILVPLVETLRKDIIFGNETTVTTAVNYSLLERAYFHSSYIILLFFGIGGLLYWLSVSTNNKRFSLANAAIILIFLIYGASILGITNLLTGRWLLNLSFLLVILASAYILEILQHSKARRKLIFAIICLYSFLSLIQFSPDFNNNFIMTENVSRTQFKLDEISALEKINNIYGGTVKTDYSYSGKLMRQLDTNFEIEPFDINYISHNFRDADGTLILLRKYALVESVAIIMSPTILKYTSLTNKFFSRFSSNYNYYLVYNNGNIVSYLAHNSKSPPGEKKKILLLNNSEKMVVPIII
jgi:hypothetical protein